MVPAHSELVDAFRSVPRGRADNRVFQFPDRTAARWITPGIAAAGLVTLATGTDIKGPGSHSLRHSCVIHWLQSGLNVNAVSARLGHSSPTVTLDIYLGDLRPRRQRIRHRRCRLSLTEDDAMQGHWRSRKKIYLWLVISISIVGLLGLAVMVGTFLYVLATFT